MKISQTDISQTTVPYQPPLSVLFGLPSDPQCQVQPTQATSRLLRLMNKQDEATSSEAASQSELSCDEAHLFALLRQYNKERKPSGEKCVAPLDDYFVSPVLNKQAHNQESSQHNTTITQLSKQLDTQDMSQFVDSLLEEARPEAMDDEFEKCSQFLVGSDLVSILNDKSEAAAHEIKQVTIETKLTSEFDFPDGGWVCCSCQNYNFQGRQKCNRCLKVKSYQDQNGKPKHLLKQKAKESKQKNKENQSAKQGERVGDWVCVACTNLNFSFRQVCNRCWRDRTQSATMVLQTQNELQKFKTAGGSSEYLQQSLGCDAVLARRKAQTVRPASEVFNTLNSQAACFLPKASK